MEKDGELLDDSALINAFNQAISNYKKMHGKGFNEDTNTSAVDVNISNSNGLTSFDDTSNPETHDQRNYNSSHAIPEVGEIESLETAKEIEVADSKVPREHPVEDQYQNNSIPQDMDEYNQLYKQYYEVEEQRQKILEKMQKFNYWHDSYPSEEHVSGLQWATSSATQGYQSSTSQPPCGTMAASCSAVTCPLAGVSTNNLCALSTKDMEKLSGVQDADIVKIAMEAAEKALSTLKDRTSDSVEKSEQNNAAEQDRASETYLSTVLNAWYSAGFHTGKYLAEQSFAKKQSDSM